jgi:hypothetical protein
MPTEQMQLTQLLVPIETNTTNLINSAKYCWTNAATLIKSANNFWVNVT